MKIIAGLFLFLPLASPGFAQCSIPYCSAVIPTTPATASVASGNLGSTSFRVEARLHGQNWTSGSNANIFSVGGYGAFFLGGNGIGNAVFFTGTDTSSLFWGNCYVSLGASAPADLIVRIDRDLVNAQIRGEVFNTVSGAQIGNACVFPITSVASGGAIQSAAIALGDPNGAALGGDIAFLRWFNLSVPAGTTPVVGISTPSALGDWEFDNNLRDSSGNGRSFSGIVSYVNTPIYSPACSTGPSQAVRLGSSLALNGASSNPLDGGSRLTFAWSYFAGSDGVNQSPTLTGAGTATPTVSGLNQFGSADFQLSVTDGSGNTSTCSVHDGVVAADANGVISLSTEGLDPISQKFIGPLIMYGANPWPWADTIHKTEMDLQIQNLANTYTPFWRTAEPGTISVTAGSNIVTGTGTNLTAPCGGGNTPWDGAGSSFIFLIYPGTDGLTHYMNATVISCTDANHLVMSVPNNYPSGPGAYPTGTPQTPWPDCTAACTGWSWQWGYFGDTVYSPQDQYGAWIYNSAPGNYYDNAKAFYALYLRSGIDTYKTAFQNLADEWWEFPVMDQGYACNNADSSCWAPAAWRSMALNGIVLRALNEGSGSTKWAGLWVVAQLAQGYIGYVASLPAPVTIDARETGYAMSMLSYCALADPNPSHQSFCRAAIKTSLSIVWTPFRRPDVGNAWAGFQYSNQVSANQASSITSLGGTGSACVTSGSTTVTGTGTNWTSAANTFNIWFFGGNPSAAPLTNADGDSVVYGITVNSATSLTLSSAYAGATACTGVSGSNRGYVMGYEEINPAGSPNTNGLVGWGILPYSEGMLGTGFGWAAMAMDGYDAPSAALFRSYLDDTVQWLITYGMDPLTGGLYYGSMFPGCVPPIAPGNVACGTTENQSQTRTLSLDVMRAFSMDYQNTGSPTVKAAADALMSQMFSKPGTGGPNPDGFYISDFDGFFTTGGPPVGSAPKWAGQLCGFEETCDMWPAVRLGGINLPFTIGGAVAVSGKGTIH
jgi:hypothetical protein